MQQLLETNLRVREDDLLKMRWEHAIILIRLENNKIIRKQKKNFESWKIVIVARMWQTWMYEGMNGFCTFWKILLIVCTAYYAHCVGLESHNFKLRFLYRVSNTYKPILSLFFLLSPFLSFCLSLLHQECQERQGLKERRATQERWGVLETKV